MRTREYSHGNIIIKLFRNFYRENEFEDVMRGLLWIENTYQWVI